MRSTPSRDTVAMLLGLLCLPACSSTSFKVPIQVDPPTARVYINGTRVGQGDRFVYDVDFGADQRVCIQAAAKGYEPRTLLLTRQQLKDQLSGNTDLRWTLIQERQ